MFESQTQQRKSQRSAAIMAVCIIAGLLILMPIGGGFADWLNAANAPTTEVDRYSEKTVYTSGAFDMDSKAFRGFNTETPSYYVAYNSTGKKHYHNLTHSSGVCSVTGFDIIGKMNIGNDTMFTANVSYAQGYPYFDIYFDYTAKEAYDDGMVRCRLALDTLYNGSYAYARVITLKAGSQVLYTKTLASDDSKATHIKNITLNVNDLRRGIIEDPDGSYFNLKITGMAPALSIAGSQMMIYNITKTTNRDDALYIVSALAGVLCWAGIFLVQPRYSLPFGKGGKK